MWAELLVAAIHLAFAVVAHERFSQRIDQAMNEQLVGMCEAQDPRLMPHLPRLAALLTEALGGGKSFISGPVGLRAAACLHQLKGRVPGETY